MNMGINVIHNQIKTGAEILTIARILPARESNENDCNVGNTGRNCRFKLWPEIVDIGGGLAFLSPSTE